MSRDLQQRTAYAQDCRDHQAQTFSVPVRPSKYQNWRGSENLMKAVEAYNSGSCT